jgi:hypothetical protein
MNYRNWLRLTAKNFPIKRTSTAKPSSRRRLILETLEDRTVPAVFLVTNTADVGAGSFRQAILDANASPNVGGPDVINFNIPGSGVHTISPHLPLPDITDPASIDGYTQPGASPNTNGPGLGDNAVLQIELDGTNTGETASGLVVSVGNSTIKGLTINRFGIAGILVNTAGGNVVAGNFLGTDPTGQIAKGNVQYGILTQGYTATATSPRNTIGGLDPASRNVISGNGSINLAMLSNGDLVEGNFVGTDATGTHGFSAVAGFRSGLFVGGNNNLIGGTSPEARNLISGNLGSVAGLEFYDNTNGNVAEGNYIGTDVTGTNAVANVIGIHSIGVNTIGGPTGIAGTGAGNLISGNTNIGVYAAYGTIQGNLIGTDANGTYAIGNGRGVHAGAETIGGTSADERNVISGNGDGLFIGGGCVVQGNYIGTDINGTSAFGLGNTSQGIYIYNGEGDVVGGTAPGARNVITASGSADIRIQQSTNVVIQGNYIGLDKSGNRELPHYSFLFGAGILVTDQVDNAQIGGATPEARNVIGGHSSGIGISNTTTSGVVVEGNSIGIGADGITPVPNETGIWLFGGTSNNLIGGIAPVSGNIVANNLGAGILLSQYHLAPFTTGNAIRGNSIYNNGGLGIDIAQPSGEQIDGPNTNDPGDADVGNNNSQNYPVLTSVVGEIGSTTIHGTLNSTPNSIFRVEFFSNATVKPNGHSEGEHYLGFTNVTTDGSGNVSFSFLTTVSTLGQYITTTATDQADNTSEFSLAYQTPVTIPPTLSFTTSEQTVSESIGVRNVTATLSSPLTHDLVVPLLVSGTAGPADVTLSTASITILTGQTTGFVTLSIIDDRRDEFDETFVLRIGNVGSNAIIGAIPTHTLTILDNDSAPGVYFATSSIIAPEESGNVTITARVTEISEKPITISLGMTGALLNGDCAFPDGSSITIPAGFMTGYYTIRLIDDPLPEPVETLTVRMQAPTNALLATTPGATTQFVITVPVSDTPTVSFTSIEKTFAESVGQISIAVHLSVASTLDVVVPISYSGSASYGVDYTAPISILIPHGQTDASLSITAVDDNLAEDPEAILITMGVPTNAFIGSRGAYKATISASDTPTVGFASASQSIWEGDAFNLTVQLSNPSPTPVVVAITLVSYQASYSVTIPANQTQGSITLHATNDDKNTPNWSYTFNIKSVTTNGVPVTWPVAVKSQKITVMDNDPYITFTTSSQTTVGEKGTYAATIQLYDASGKAVTSNKPVTATLELNGIASRGVVPHNPAIKSNDYTSTIPSNGVVTIPTGQSSTTVYFTISDDPDPEQNETIVVTMNSISNALVVTKPTQSFVVDGFNYISTPPFGLLTVQPYGHYVTVSASQNTHTITIDDNDKPTIGFTSAGDTYTEKDSGSNFGILIPVHLSDKISDEVKVKYSITGVAANSSDLTGSLSGIVTIPAGFQSASISLSIRGDNIYEATEKATITLSSPTNASLGTSKYTLTIKDNDPAPVPTQPPAAIPVHVSLPGALAIDTNGGGLYSSLPVGPVGGVLGGGDVMSFAVGTVALYVNGFMSDGIVFFDANKNGVLDYIDLNGNGVYDDTDIAEPASQTGADGRFEMTIPSFFDLNGNGLVDPTEGHLVAIGGVDISTGLSGTIPLIAPGGSFVATPLTTLMVGLTDNWGMTLDDAQVRVREALGLPSDIVLTQFDPVTAGLSGDLAGVAIFAAHAKVQNSILQAANLISGASDGLPISFVADAIVSNMSNAIVEPGSELNLSDPFVVETVLRGSASRLGVALSDDVFSGAAQVIAAGNQAIESIDSVDLEGVMNAISKAKVVARTNVTTQLASVGAGTLDINTVVQNNTAAALQGEIAAAVAGDLTPPVLSVSDARVVEGNSGESFLVFAVAPDRASTRSVSIGYYTADYDATEADGDYEPTTGTLTWEPGDLSLKTVAVRVFGDTRFETDESALLMLWNPTNALIGQGIGKGVIVNDDALAYYAPNDGKANNIALVFTDDGIALSRNDEIVFSGGASVPVPVAIHGFDGVQNTLTLELNSTTTTPAWAVTFSGGSGPDDQINVQNGVHSPMTNTITGSSSGNWVIGEFTLVYSGVEHYAEDITPVVAMMSTCSPN